MPDDDDIKLPTQPGSPTSEHGQMMFAMGQMVAQIKGLKEAQLTANGRTGKIETRVSDLEHNQDIAQGKDIGVSKLTLVIFNVITAVVAVAALILKFTK
jgi:hypothetical protein